MLLLTDDSEVEVFTVHKGDTNYFGCSRCLQGSSKQVLTFQKESVADVTTLVCFTVHKCLISGVWMTWSFWIFTKRLHPSAPFVFWICLYATGCNSYHRDAIASHTAGNECSVAVFTSSWEGMGIRIFSQNLLIWDKTFIITAKMVHHSGDGIMAQHVRVSVCVCMRVFSCRSTRRVCLLCACLDKPVPGSTASVFPSECVCVCVSSADGV